MAIGWRRCRQLLRVTHCFVSHTHMDHFAGFDRLLRVCLHRPTPLHLIGPTGFADHVKHKLKAYTLKSSGAQSGTPAPISEQPPRQSGRHRVRHNPFRQSGVLGS
jgi:ribonuclease BN (tRNA processing enzyme)